MQFWARRMADRPRASNSQTETVAGGLIVQTGTCYEHHSLSGQRLTAVSALHRWFRNQFPFLLSAVQSSIAACAWWGRYGAAGCCWSEPESRNIGTGKEISFENQYLLSESRTEYSNPNKTKIVTLLRPESNWFSFWSLGSNMREKLKKKNFQWLRH